MESNNNNSNNNNSLEQRFRMEIMRKDASTSPRKGRRPLVLASKSFDESCMMPFRNSSSLIVGASSPRGAAAAAMSGAASTSGCSVVSSGSGSVARGGTRAAAARRMMLPDFMDITAPPPPPPPPPTSLSNNIHSIPLPSPSAGSLSSKSCVSRASSLPKEELKNMRLLCAPPMSRRGSTGNCGGYAPLDMYGGSNHSSTKSAASDSTNASSSSCSTAAASNNNEPSFIRAIRRGSLSKEESQRKLQEQLNMVQDYDDQSDCESTSRQALKDRFAPSKKNIKNKPRRVSRRSSIASTGSNYSITANLNAGTEHSKSSLGTMSNMSLDLFDMSPGTPNNNFNNNSNSEDSGNNNNNNSGGRKTLATLPGRSVSMYSPQTPHLPVANVLERTVSSPLHSYNALNKQPSKTDQIIESLVWFSFHVPRTVLEDLISYEIQVWKNQAVAAEAAAPSPPALPSSSAPSNNNMNMSSHHTAASSKRKQRRQERRKRAQRAILRSSKMRDGSDTDSEDDIDNNDNDYDRYGYDASDDGENDNDSGTGGSVSSLSEDEGAGGGGGRGHGGAGGGAGPGAGAAGCGPGGNDNNFDVNFTESMMRFQGETNAKFMVNLPRAVKRECALLFVDMSGFTKLSTMLDVESLSKVINSYFDMIVSEVIHHGGDILKFAGDAFFAEWKVPHEQDGDSSSFRNGNNSSSHHYRCGALADLNASLVSINDMDWDFDNDIPKLSSCVLAAAKCAVSIVEKFSDYHVTSASGSTNDAMLNVHCGLGVGHVVGLHVGDYKEDQEEEGVELRREFLILGDAIEQVSEKVFPCVLLIVVENTTYTHRICSR
jgi:class 3 adenylate cyclase